MKTSYARRTRKVVQEEQHIQYQDSQPVRLDDYELDMIKDDLRSLNEERSRLEVMVGSGDGTIEHYVEDYISNSHVLLTVGEAFAPTAIMASIGYIAGGIPGALICGNITKILLDLSIIAKSWSEPYSSPLKKALYKTAHVFFLPRVAATYYIRRKHTSKDNASRLDEVNSKIKTYEDLLESYTSS